MRNRSINILCLLVALVPLAARAANLPAFEASDCHGDRDCVGRVSDGPYMALAVVWNKFADDDQKFCMAHESYARHYSGFYYADVLNCLMVRDFQRHNID